jgi:Zn-dependent M28 family amino/carboxypeptidase
LSRIKGVINLDAGAPPGRPWSWRIAGGDRQPLGHLAQDVAADHGWSATTSPATPNSDYYPFVRVGVQAVFIVPGPGPYQGLSVDSSQALRRRWDRYHDPADEWAPDFPFAGLGRYAEYAYYIGRVLGGGGARLIPRN